MSDPATSPPPSRPTPAAAPAPAGSPLQNQPPPSATPGRWALNLLIAVAFALFAFSGYWLYLGYRQRAADAVQREQRSQSDKALLGGALGPDDLQPAADTALTFLKQRPEFREAVGELLQPDQPVEYRMQLTAELGNPDDLKFRMTIRGAKSHAWYDTILRPSKDGWQLLAASLTLPDAAAPDGRKVVILLEPPPDLRPPTPAPAPTPAPTPAPAPPPTPTSPAH